MLLSGKVWKLGNNIGATDLVSAKYDKEAMNRDWEACSKHVLEDLIPAFTSDVQEGDIIVAGFNFGSGHAHYFSGAINGSRAAGVGGMLAESVNTLFLRAAIDAGIPVWQFKGITEAVENGDMIEMDLATGVLTNKTSGKIMQFKAVSPIILDILNAGGSYPWALDRVTANK